MRTIVQLIGALFAAAFLFIAYLVMGAIVGSFLDGWIPVLEPLANLRLQLAGLCVLFMLICLGFWRWRLAAVLFAFSFLTVATLVDDLINIDAHAEWEAATLRLLVFDVDHEENWQYAKTLDYIRASGADLVLLQDVDEHWFVQIELLSDVYPHRLARPREDEFGAVLLSKIPFENAELLYFSKARVPVLWALLKMERRSLHFFGFRPSTPNPLAEESNRITEFEALARQAREADGMVIVAGSMATTSRSSSLQKLLEKGELTNASLGFGFQPTWPVSIPLLGMTLDQVLISNHLRVVDYKRGPNLGSQHFPVVMDLTRAKRRRARSTVQPETAPEETAKTPAEASD